ncbi:hypothetical protein [Dyadobacter sp. NIV53]|uniref:hypothetical protein n=1 Tax=Dyadobacter sp. NIV53 TaxID=2861765 RepID=UPI001C87B2F2|nr:hypothetical protein [Dyadobacter sp. NIV53]
MNRKLNLLISCLLIVLISCKKENDVSPADAQFLKAVWVKGASEIQLDNASGVILITLPESYTSDIVYLDLDLAAGATLEANPSSKRIGFYFKGAYPKPFVIERKNGDQTSTDLYTVYVEHTGKLSAVITSDMLLYPGQEDYGITYIKFNSGIGTVPGNPESTKVPMPTLTGSESSIYIPGRYDVGLSYLSFKNASPLFYSKNITLSLSYGEKKFQFAEKPQIKRAPLSASISSIDMLFRALPKDKKIGIAGGFFLPNLKYQIKAENDFMENALWLKANYLNNYSLDFEIPSQMADGIYLLTFYEDDTPIKSINCTVTNDSTQTGIGQIWTEEMDCPTEVIFDNPKRITLKKGDIFYVNPHPLEFQSQYNPLDKYKTLPNLELKTGSEISILTPIVRADWCFGDHSVFVYYGEYKIPQTLPQGKYEARLIYPNSGPSFPYPYLLEVQ